MEKNCRQRGAADMHTCAHMETMPCTGCAILDGLMRRARAASCCKASTVLTLPVLPVGRKRIPIPGWACRLRECCSLCAALPALFA